MDNNAIESKVDNERSNARLLARFGLPRRNTISNHYGLLIHSVSKNETNFNDNDVFNHIRIFMESCGFTRTYNFPY